MCKFKPGRDGFVHFLAFYGQKSGEERGGKKFKFA
jgi:hypothetical protein